MDLNKYTYLDNGVKRLINDTIKDDELFNEECFVKWVEDLNILKLNNPSAYIYTYFKTEYLNGRFYKKKQIINIIQLHKRLESLGYSGSTTNHFLLEEIINHAIYEMPLTQEQMQGVINDVVASCRTKTYKAFIEGILKHPLVVAKCHFPLPHLIKLAKSQAEQWDTMIKDLEQKDMTMEEVLQASEGEKK